MITRWSGRRQRAERRLTVEGFHPAVGEAVDAEPSAGNRARHCTHGVGIVAYIHRSDDGRFSGIHDERRP